MKRKLKSAMIVYPMVHPGALPIMPTSAQCDKIIVSLTTIPSRVGFLHQTINSLRAQTIQPDSIELNIPDVYKKRSLGSMDFSLLPNDISIIRCEDFGPATKLLPTLQRYSGKNVCIIYCDDDRIYDKGLIERLLTCHDKFPNSAIADEVVEIKSRYFAKVYRKNFAYRLRRFLSGGRWKPSRNNPFKGQIAEGFGGVLVKPSFFTERVFNIDEEFMMVDDIWFSAMLAHNNVGVKFSGRKPSEKSKDVIADGETLGRRSDSLVKSVFDDMGRNDLDWRAIETASRRYAIWEDALSELSFR